MIVWVAVLVLVTTHGSATTPQTWEVLSMVAVMVTIPPASTMPTELYVTPPPLAGSVSVAGSKQVAWVNSTGAGLAVGAAPQSKNQIVQYSGVQF